MGSNFHQLCYYIWAATSHQLCYSIWAATSINCVITYGQQRPINCVIAYGQQGVINCVIAYGQQGVINCVIAYEQQGVINCVIAYEQQGVINCVIAYGQQRPINCVIAYGQQRPINCVIAYGQQLPSTQRPINCVIAYEQQGVIDCVIAYGQQGVINCVIAYEQQGVIICVIAYGQQGVINCVIAYEQQGVINCDKSSCIAPQSIKYLIGDDDDVIHINAGSGVITAHLASIMHKSSGHIHAFGANPTLLQANLEKLGARRIFAYYYFFMNLKVAQKKFILFSLNISLTLCPDIKVQQEPFLDVETDDNKFKNVKVVLYLSVGETDDSKLGEMIASHGALLKHAMKLSKVQAIVYMTRSVNESENENVVNLMQQRKFPWRVVPPVLPFSGNDIERSIGITGKFIKFSPSERNCGCFVAVITREPEDIKEAHKDVLERARARGLLGGKKKSKKPSEEEVEEAEDSPGEDDKLLERRVKRAPRKLRQANSFPLNLPHYNKPSASSIVRSQIYAKPKGVQRATRSTPAINHKGHIQRVKELANPHEKKEKNPVVAEHVKVVKHPAPF
ncbi:NSUN7-like protein, partial [Mya arenaria]